MITLISTEINGKLHTAQIASGKLMSYTVDDFEFIHQRAVGWPHSDTEMFPIIGPTAAANYRVQVGDQSVVLDQHGLLREFSYTHLDSDSELSIWIKKYKAYDELANSKYPENSPETVQFWPYDFEFLKSFGFDDNGLVIRFEIIADPRMPFMLGYHPAFKLNPGFATRIESGSQQVGLQQVLDAGSRALAISQSNRVVVHNERSVVLETEGFSDFMCWTEVPQMLCVEPITFYPYGVDQNNLHEGFQLMGTELREFITRIYPLNQ